MKRAESRLWAVSWAAGQASLLTGVISEQCCVVVVDLGRKGS